jgi:hypothetical protein
MSPSVNAYHENIFLSNLKHLRVNILIYLTSNYYFIFRDSVTIISPFSNYMQITIIYIHILC